MAYAPYRRATLLIPVDGVPHLFIILNDPCEEGLCLLVMISSIKPKRFHDKACVLKQGDHEFIKKDSFVVYRIAEPASASHIGNMVEKKFYMCKADVSEAVYKRVVDGLFASDETRPSVIRYAEDNDI